MSDTSGELDDGFVRQRRNLILVSIGLLAAMHYGLSLDKINLLGNETKLASPEPVAGFLWWVWAYFLWRFSTASLEIRDRGILSAFVDKRWRSTIRSARRWWQHTEHAKYEGAKFVQAGPRQVRDSIGGVEANDWSVFLVSFSQPTNHVDDRGRQHINTNQQSVAWIVPWSVRMSTNIDAALRLTFATQKVSEHIVPFLFGAAPPAYWLMMRFGAM